MPIKLNKTEKLVSKKPKTLQAFWEIIRISWEVDPRSFMLIIGLTSLQGSARIGSAWILKLLFDILASSWQSGLQTDLSDEIIPLLSIQAGIMIGNQLLSLITGFLNREYARKLKLNSQKAVYSKINSLKGIQYFESPDFHDTLRLGLQSAQSTLVSIQTKLTRLVDNGVTLIGFVGVLLIFNPLLAAGVIIASIPSLLSQLDIARKRHHLDVHMSPDNRMVYYIQYIMSETRTAKELRSFDSGNYLLNLLISTQEKIHGKEKTQDQIEFKRDILLNSLSAIVYSLAFAMVVFQVYYGNQNIGDVSLYTSAVQGIQAATGGIISIAGTFKHDALQFTKFLELMQLPQSIIETSNPTPMHSLKNKIEFKNVSFRYSDEHPYVLNNLNLEIQANSCLALVGKNGSGKTTIIKLLLRLYDPSEGGILWDGVDIREFDVLEYRKKIGAIFQDFVAYNLTVKENIGIANIENINDIDEIKRVAKMTNIHDAIKKLPEEYDSVLSRWLTNGKIGADLSGGQWQKVAMARLFMRNANLLIMDEPTSALDAQSEHEIFLTITELVQNNTCLLVSHRFSTTSMADKIAVIDNGQVIEYGTHAELMDAKSNYAELYRLQADKYQI